MEEEKNDDEINLLDYLIVLAKRKKLIIAITLSIAIITTIISFSMTPIYKAETSILPPSGSRTNILRQFMGNRFEGLAGLANSIVGNRSVYIDIIKSRTVFDRIIDRFKLMDIYKAKYRKTARKKLKRMVKVKTKSKSQISSSRIIIISVYNKDPKMAADMANAFVEELQNLLNNLAITEASQRRLFFEEQLKQAAENLVKSEDAMREFQEKTGILNFDLLMPSARIPAVATEFLRKTRDLKYNEKLFGIMASQYETAKVDEARDSAFIQVIDRAVVPEKKVKPKRRLMVKIATLTGFFLAVFTAFFVEYLERQSEGGKDKGRIETLKRHLYFKRKK